MFTTEEFAERIGKLITETASDEQAAVIEELKKEREEIEDIRNKSDGGEWKKKYDKLHSDYINRFFSGNTDKSDTENNAEIEIVNNDDEIKNIEDILY